LLVPLHRWLTQPELKGLPDENRSCLDRVVTIEDQSLQEIKINMQKLACFSGTDLLVFPATLSPRIHHDLPRISPRFARKNRKNPRKNATPPRQKNYKI
jgi:hypothetical protein